MSIPIFGSEKQKVCQIFYWWKLFGTSLLVAGRECVDQFVKELLRRFSLNLFSVSKLEDIE